VRLEDQGIRELAQNDFCIPAYCMPFGRLRIGRDSDWWEMSDEEKRTK